MTVYAVNSTRDDISDAYRYGDVRYINIGYVYNDQLENERLPGNHLEAIRRYADAFDPARDYFLIVGDHLQLLAFAAELAVRHPYFRVLRFDRREQAYVPVRIDCSQSISVNGRMEPGKSHRVA